MSKTNQNQYATSLRKINFGQTATFPRNDRNAVAAEVRKLNDERNPYKFKQTTTKSGDITVQRVIPTNLYDRSLYIESINKKQLESALRSNNWSKEATARTFGISARSIGRMIAKHSIVAKRYTPATNKANARPAANRATNSKAIATTANSKNKTR